MQRRLKLFILTVIGASFFAVACAPKQQRLQIDHPPQDFQPKVADVDVKAQGLYNMDFDQSVTVNSQVTPAFVYRLSENMMSLGASQHNEDLSSNGQKVLNKLLDLPGLAATVPASNSPFVQLAISETREEVNEALTEVDKQLKISVDQLNQTLVQLGKTYPWPAGESSLTQAGQAIAGFLAEFLAQANQLNIFDALKSQLQIEIANQQKWIEDLTTQIDQELHSAKHFPELMAYLQKLLKDQQITPPSDLQKTLDQGVLLAQDLLNCQSEQSVLTAIIDVWNILDDQQRMQYIKPESESLYNYLKKSDANDLQCLRTSGCMSPMKFLIKKVFILPKIGKMGVAKVCASIDQSALSYVVTTSQTKVSQVYPQMPSFVSDALNKAIADKMKILNTIHQDYSGFLKKQIQQWATQSLLGKGQVRGVDVGNLQVSLKDKALQLQVVAGPATAEAFGGSMAALTQYYNAPNAEMNRVQQSSFDLVNKLVALGGYTTEYGTLTPALLTPLDKAAPLLDLTHLTSQTAPYGLPDQFNVVNSFVPKEIHPAQFSMSARSQAELIRGLSKVIGYLSDWRTSAYDQTLGGITAATLVPDYKDVNELQRAMFPKAELMTLAIGDLAVTLENLTKKLAQVFVIGLHDNKITFVNDYDLENGGLVAMAGVVDINNGVRASAVRSQDLSRWIIAMSEFIKNSEGIEQTKSDLLLEKDARGATSLDALVKARGQLKLLTLAFANLLSHQMVDQDGLVMSQLKLTDLGTDAGQKSLLDQAMAIQALNQAADATGISIYRVSATELYYTLNSKKYLAKMHFYSMSGNVETMDLETLSETLRAISELKPSLPEKSQAQADWILDPWLKGLSQLH